MTKSIINDVYALKAWQFKYFKRIRISHEEFYFNLKSVFSLNEYQAVDLVFLCKMMREFVGNAELQDLGADYYYPVLNANIRKTFGQDMGRMYLNLFNWLCNLSLLFTGEKEGGHSYEMFLKNVEIEEINTSFNEIKKRIVDMITELERTDSSFVNTLRQFYDVNSEELTISANFFEKSQKHFKLPKHNILNNFESLTVLESLPPQNGVRQTLEVFFAHTRELEWLFLETNYWRNIE